MLILNRFILVLMLALASGASCRCGLDMLMELTGCNPLVCGDFDDPEADNCREDASPADECCPDDPAESDEPDQSEPSGPAGGDCLCCSGKSESAVTGRDELILDASDLLIFSTPPNGPGSFGMSMPLSHRIGSQRGLGPPVPPVSPVLAKHPATLLRQRTLLQV